MDAYEAIVGNVERFIRLTEEERQYFNSILQVTNVRKKQFVVQPEFVCRHHFFISKGAMRSYAVDPAGQEHTIVLGIDDWWITDVYSYVYQTPAALFVEAFEDSTIVKLEHNAEELLRERYPKFEKFFRILSMRALANFQRRTLSNLSLTAEQRYDEFLGQYPAIAARVPQYALASYLGMTTEHLSKIRGDKRRRIS
jgi:CRP-like cAMP-binding protein